jgi:hypothetical protein
MFQNRRCCSANAKPTRKAWKGESRREAASPLCLLAHSPPSPPLFAAAAAACAATRKRESGESRPIDRPSVLPSGIQTQQTKPENRDRSAFPSSFHRASSQFRSRGGFDLSPFRRLATAAAAGTFSNRPNLEKRVGARHKCHHHCNSSRSWGCGGTLQVRACLLACRTTFLPPLRRRLGIEEKEGPGLADQFNNIARAEDARIRHDSRTTMPSPVELRTRANIAEGDVQTNAEAIERPFDVAQFAALREHCTALQSREDYSVPSNQRDEGHRCPVCLPRHSRASNRTSVRRSEDDWDRLLCLLLHLAMVR